MNFDKKIQQDKREDRWERDVEARLDRLDSKQVYIDTKLSAMSVEHESFRHTIAALSNGFSQMDKMFHSEIAAIKRDGNRSDFWIKTSVGLFIVILFIIIIAS